MITFLLDGLWGAPSRLRFFKDNLERSGCGRVEIHPYRSSGLACLAEEGELLAKRIAAAQESVNLVGYSMGGLVARAARLADRSLEIRRLVCVNTPHRGSILARFLPGAGFRQMRPGSEFLKRLDAEPWNAPSLAIWTPGDLMVIPAWSARWERASATEKCPVPAHIWPLFSRAIHEKIARFLALP